MSRTLRRLAVSVCTTGALYAGITLYTAPPRATSGDLAALAHGGLERVPSRETQLERLFRASDACSAFDVVVIGGGATGAACALDATLRDLNVALVERDDFASGTSSRSTKLIHGGVRYLEKAFFNLDPGQLKLVFEALSERAVMLYQAPHLAQPFPTLLPCYRFWEVPFYWAGLKVYDLVASLGHGFLYLSKFVTAHEALRLFPTLAKSSNGHRLRGAIMYYDGQMDDSRYNLSVALTSALHGATVANHVDVQSLIRDEHGQVVGVNCRDVLTDRKFSVRARVVVNATGPFTDSIRRMEDPQAESMVAPSAGVHITLPSYYSADGMGLIVPKTKDGRVVFMLPWLGATIAGTTDSSTDITRLPQPHKEEVSFILDALSDYLRIDVRTGDVQSAWSGIRPLAIDAGTQGEERKTKNILRDHVVSVSDGNMVTITGGKWTTQRAMGEAAIDKAIQVGRLSGKATSCKTRFVRLVGAHKWDESYFTFLAQRYVTNGHGWAVGNASQSTAEGPAKNDPDTAAAVGRRIGERTDDRGDNGTAMSKASNLLDVECATHLSRAYGDQAYKVAELAEHGYGRRLVEGYPIIEAEIVYCVENEYCETAADFLARRCRLVFLNGQAALAALPHVVNVMGNRLNWSDERRRKEIEEGRELIWSFSCAIPRPQQE